MSLNIYPESTLKGRDFRIHEAGHIAVGIMLKLPMLGGEIFRDGSGGRANLDWDTIRQTETTDTRELDQFDARVKIQASLNIACMYAGGFAAECIASQTPRDDIIGAKSHDMVKALEALALAEAPPEIYLPIAWTKALRILETTWPAVIELAGTIPITDGHHHTPPKFH